MKFSYLCILKMNHFMKLKLSLVFVLMLMLSGSVLAESVDETTARSVAAHFYSMNSKSSVKSSDVKLVYSGETLRDEKNTVPSFYVFNINTEGFVIVAGDNRMQPVLAFSDEGPFVSDDMPAHIRFFLDGYAEEIRYIIRHQERSDMAVMQQWKNLLSGTSSGTEEGEVVVGPLLGGNKWNQTQYYNDLCPADATGNPAYGGHAAAGCGAVVMGQVMRYWHYPATGAGNHSYSSNYGTLSANFGETDYRYDIMPDKLTASSHPDSCVEAVATLLYHCGVSVNMYYGPAASVANSNNIVAALSTYFRYPETVLYIERGSIPYTTWLSYLKDELDDGAPFMYGGSGNYGGHVWTCDGYRDDNYFHFNWGWGGQQNGYFALTNCSSYGFNSNHAVIIGIRGPELPVDIEGNNAQKVLVYPNPTDGMVCLSCDPQQVKEVQLFDLSGKMLLRQSVCRGDVSIDLSTYSAGIYFLRILGENGVEIRKIVKE